MQRFQELFSQTKYKEAAELAAESPQGILRTPETVAKFQVVNFISPIFFLLPAYLEVVRCYIVIEIHGLHLKQVYTLNFFGLFFAK